MKPHVSAKRAKYKIHTGNKNEEGIEIIQSFWRKAFFENRNWNPHLGQTNTNHNYNLILIPGS